MQVILVYLTRVNETRRFTKLLCLMRQKVVKFSLREKKGLMMLGFTESLLAFLFVLNACFLSAIWTHIWSFAIEDEAGCRAQRRSLCSFSPSSSVSGPLSSVT